ncbi:hypothetical protein M4D70_15970 [Brevibacillus borstelensis]|nr:hypothetical protein [Brevibacillus borstelensis]MCM3623729.1 hypothetical protein [Brevibacillus borstelensis]
MSTEFSKLFKTDEEIKKEIIYDFTSELLREVNKLVEMYGKEGLLEKIKG